MKALVATVIAIGALALGADALMAQSGNDLFQQALVKERTEGNPTAAIALYQTIVDKHRSDRALVAKALVQMAQCYEKLGRSDALKTYERVVREFGDQKTSIATARARLTVLMQPATRLTLDQRVIWTDASLGPATISPDGRHLVYVSPGNVGGLYVRDLRAGLNRRLIRPAPATDPGRPNTRFAFSPDGKLVAYGWQDRPGASPTLRLISLDGTPSRVPYDTNEWTAVAPRDWSADGREILGLAHARGVDTKDFVLVSVADGSVRIVKRGIDVEGERISGMTLSRDGRYLAYDYPARGKSGENDIFIMSVAGGPETRLVARPADDRLPIFTPDGIFFLSVRPGRNETWFLRVVDGRPQGSPELLQLEVGTPVGFIQNGSFVHVDRLQTIKLFAATLDPVNGTIVGQPAIVTQRPLGSTRSVVGWSPDGQFLAYGSTRRSAVGQLDERIIVIRTVQSGEEREIAPGFRGWGWSPDGGSLLAEGTDQGRRVIVRIDARTGDIVPLLQTAAGEILDRPNWFGGGNAIVFIRRVAAGAQIVWRDLEAGREIELYRPPAGLSLGSSLEVSADGRRLAFLLQNDTEGIRSVMTLTATAAKPREIEGLRWKYPERITEIAALTPDGQYVLFTTGDVEQPYLGQRLWRSGVDGGGLQEIHIQKEYSGTGRAVFHPNGTQFAFAVVGGQQTVWVAENFLPKGGAR